MNKDKLRQRAKERIGDLIVELAGALDANGWENPAGQIEFVLAVLLNPAISELSLLVQEADEPSGFGEIPEDVSLPDLHESV